jgi:hypothetical protein
VRDVILPDRQNRIDNSTKKSGKIEDSSRKGEKMAKPRMNISNRHMQGTHPKEAGVPETKQKKMSKCTVCGTNTYQKEKICVLCAIGIRQKYEELIDLLKQQDEKRLLKLLSMMR